MIKTFAIAGALALALTTPAAAQSGLLNDWNIADAKTALVASGATVLDSGTTTGATPALYVSAQAPDGMKFLVYGTVCSGAQLRCKGMNLSAGFTLASDAEVNRRVAEIDRMAVGVRNGGNNSLTVNRYVIFDNGLTRANLQTNIEVFLAIASDIWNGGGK